MPRRLVIAGLLLFGAAGCGQNPYTVNRQNQILAQQQQTIASLNQELTGRAKMLDADNEQLQQELGLAKQQVQLAQDELAATRDQLRSATQQLASVRGESKNWQKQTEALAASVQRHSAATISANNSLTGQLTSVHLEGVEVRQDGEVIRIELPADKIFAPSSSTLTAGASPFIDAVMADVLRTYPNQQLGIEGHTDSDPIRTPQFPSNHHLASARAVTVYEYIARRFQIPEKQMFVAGHGSNFPVVSNATLPGKARNRRVEIVVYPETYQR